MVELDLDGRIERTMVATIPGSAIVRFFKVEQEEILTLLSEKVLK